MCYQLGQEDPRGLVIERAHRTQTKTSPRSIHCCFLNWEDKEYILKVAPGRLKQNPFGRDQINIYVTDDVSKKSEAKGKSSENNTCQKFARNRTFK